MGSTRTLTILVAAALVATVTGRECLPELDVDIPQNCLDFESPSDNIHLAHEWNCEQFYQCVHGKRVLMKCGMRDGTKRLHFNPRLQVCDWPECAGCNVTILVPDPSDCTKYYAIVNDQKISKTCTDGKHFSPKEKTCMSPSKAGCEPSGRPCEGVPDGKLVADNADCSKYFVCNNNSAVWQECSGGFHFDPSCQGCVLPSVALCNYTVLEPYPDDCTKYYEIHNGVTSVKTCSGGQHFSPTEKICMSPDEAGCKPKEGPCVNMTDGQLLPDDTDCGKYFVCENENAIPLDCPENLHFNASLQDCVLPSVALCNYTVLEPHPDDCTKYYEIHNGVTSVKTCSGGQHFSPTEKICMSPDEAGCKPKEGPCVNMTDGQLLPDDTDCGKYFVCENENAIPLDCPENLHFNASLQDCVLPSVALCNYTVLEPYPDDCTKYYEIHNGVTSVKTCSGGQHFSPTEKICMSPDEAGCKPKDGPCVNMNDGQLLADDTDCGKFFVCKNENAIPLDCPENLHFNASLQDCVLPSVALCNYTVLEPYPDDCTKYYEIHNGVTSVKTCSGGQHFSPTEKICMSPDEAGCKPKDGPCVNMTDGQLIADDTDCGKFFVCKNENAIPLDCPENLHFNASLQDCVLPSVALCNYTVLEPYPDDCTKYYEIHNGVTSVKTCSGGQHFSPTEKICMSPDEAGCKPKDGPCVNMTDGQLIADDTDCGKFFVCKNENAIPLDCPENLHFNASLQDCVLPSVALCNYTVLEPHPDDCTKYYEIHNGVTSVKTCSGGQHFSPTEKICMSPDEAGCKPKDGPCVNMTDGQLVADDTDCGKFFVCKNENAIPLDCPENLHFNASLQDCVLPSVALCNYTVLEPYPDDCTKYYEIHNGVTSVKTCSGGQHFSPTEKICMSPDEAGCKPKDGPCVNMTDGQLVADDTDCGKYFLCKNENAIPLDCPENLHFNASLQDCVLPSVALCNYTVLEPYPDDCTKYYEIHNGVTSVKTCSGGQHFSPTEKICMSPDEAGCKPKDGACVNMTDGQLVADDTDCGKYFLCKNENAIPLDCPENLHFNASLQDCVLPSVALCNYTVLEPYPDDCTKYYEIHNGVTSVKTCSGGQHFSPTEKICMSPDKAGCDSKIGPCVGVADGSSVPYYCVCDQYFSCENNRTILHTCADGLHFSPIFENCTTPEAALCNVTLPYPGDCTKYYQILHGLQTIKSCPDGKHFSPTARECMRPSAAGCDSEICDGDLPPGSKLPHKCDCDKYILCEHGDLVLKNCPAGSHFSENLKDCVLPSIAGCVRPLSDCNQSENHDEPITSKFRSYESSNRTPRRNFMEQFFYAIDNRTVPKIVIPEIFDKNNVETPGSAIK